MQSIPRCKAFHPEDTEVLTDATEKIVWYSVASVRFSQCPLCETRLSLSSKLGGQSCPRF